MDTEEEGVIGDCTPSSLMDSAVVVKLEPAWSMEEESPDQPSAVYSTAQPMSDHTSGSLLSQNTGHVCQHCSAAFELVGNLELHLASVHEESLPDRQMPLPEERLSTEETDRVRARMANSETDFVLKLEPESWLDDDDDDSMDQPSAVYSTAQPMSDNTPESLMSQTTSHVCYICFDVFSLLSRFELHLALVHGEKLHMVIPAPSTPDRCDAGDCNNTDIDTDRKDTKRKRDCHDVDGYEKNGIRQHVCETCNKPFSRLNNLKRHRLVHTGARPFPCDICGKSFTQASYLKTHKRYHSGEKPFACDTCGKSFTVSGDLAMHQRVHDGERPYKCSHCDKDFKQPGALHDHVKSIHEGIKAHVCEVCGSGFTQRGSLAVHRRSHTGVKHYACSECGKGFADPSTLRRHRLTHSGEKPYMCSHCPSTYRYCQDLKKHIRNKHV